MDILGIVGFVFAASAIAVLVHEHQTDVLHGPYIEGRSKSRGAASIWDPVRARIDGLIARLNWNARHVVHLTWLVC
jgi:hypothetical protein